MTTREYFQAVLDAHISDTMDEASRQLIQKLDEKNAKRKATPTKEQREAAQRVLLVKGFFEKHTPNEFFTRDDIAAATGMKPAEATAACKALISVGKVMKGEAKIGKARRVVYSVPEGAQYLDHEIEA